jgi:hypothetical protein
MRQSVTEVSGSNELVHVPVRIHYLVGNHDWFFHLRGPAYDEARSLVAEALGLDNDPNAAFPHDPEESSVLQKIYRDHRGFCSPWGYFRP